MSQPLIGITTSIAPAGKGPERVSLNTDYMRSVEAAGGVPILLPQTLGPAALDALFPALGGLVVTGGGDVNPARYGETPHPTVLGVSDERDAFEAALIERALAARLPLFCICRGMQILNVALGGSLHQDIPSDFATTIQHAQTDPRETPTHAVHVQPETKLAALLGAGELRVNSMHHQSVRRLGAGLEAVAWAPDGVVEAVELPRHDGFLAAVQWHPEELAATIGHAKALFAALTAAARG
ncbi:MAG: gamma-glutamyl-gamma-aminobutyrate hydrolase family protein [Dehalococcoidia bacterium]